MYYALSNWNSFSDRLGPQTLSAPGPPPNCLIRAWSQLVINFELAAIEAIRQVFPETIIKVCTFRRLALRFRRRDLERRISPKVGTIHWIIVFECHTRPCGTSCICYSSTTARFSAANCSSSLVHSFSNNPRALWKTINKILHRTANRSLPTSSPLAALPQLFATYFSNKISKLHFNQQTNTSSTPALSLPSSPPSLLHSLNHRTHTVISILFLPLYHRKYPMK